MPNTKKDENLKLYRIHLIDEEIRSGAYPNKVTLAKKLEVSERTIARDLDYLRDFHNAPIEFDTARNGFYYTEKDFFIKYVTLSEGELFSIGLFDQMLSQYKNTPLEGQLRSIFQKITSSLPENVQVDSRFLSKDVSYISEPLAQIDTKVFDAVMSALKTHEALEIEYRSNTNGGSPSPNATTAFRKIEPYHVACKGGSWYVIAFCHKRGEVRTFSLSRISDFKRTGEHFSIPKDFKIADYIDPAFGIWASEKEKRTIKLRCMGYLAKIAEEQKWHENQRTTPQDDGSAIVEFETTQMTETLHLVLSMGENVTVLEPADLVEMVKNTAMAVAEKYK